MISMVSTFSERHQLLKRNTVVLIGVSGGPDSMALLHFYLSIREKWNLTIIAISADHQLRGKQSRADLRYVKKTCAKWDIKFVGTRLDVKAYEKEKQAGKQMASRKIRYQFYKEQMQTFKAHYLALGHHGDDQIETMLMGFVRSSSSVALSGIPFKRRFATGYIVRPFLCVTKQHIIDYCKANNITPRIDPSNEDIEYTRNFFRKRIIPIIKKQNNNIHNTAQRLSENLQIDERFIQNEANELFQEIVHLNNEENEVSFRIPDFMSGPEALQRRIYHLILNCLYGRELPVNLSNVHEQSFYSLLKNDKAHVAINFPHKLKLEKSYETALFHFRDRPLQDPFFQKTMGIPGKIHFPDGSMLTACYTKDFEREDKFTFYIPGNVTLPLHIRTRLPGDRMSWRGLKGSKKIKDIFIDAKVKRSKRDHWPIVVDNNRKIIWLVGLRKSILYNEVNKQAPYIQLTYKQAGESYVQRY